MTIPVTTRTVKGSPLTTTEMDTNLTDLGRDATEIQQGNVQFSTEAETEALTELTKAISPGNLGAGIEAFADSLASSFSTPDGYVTLPNGLIIQWGVKNCRYDLVQNNTPVVFPLAFPNTLLFVGPIDIGGSVVTTSKNTSVTASSESVSGFSIATYSNNVFFNDVGWIAIGH